MSSVDFHIYAIITISMWVLGIVLLGISKNNKTLGILGVAMLLLGSGIIVLFLANLWSTLDRPPMRTLGETRLWYSLFLSIIGLIFYWRWKYYWFILYSFSLAGLFLVLNIYHPENFSRTLMPALLSLWFIPHVIVYIVAYALLGASSIVALKQLFDTYVKGLGSKPTLQLADNLVYLGFSFLTMGLLFGALWAKEAWGHYWTWDPKETWAFLTWATYLIYIHARIKNSLKPQHAMWILAFAFVVLLVAWFGVNYLPSAVNSVHTYSQ